MVTYTPFHADWQNFPDTSTPVTAEFLEYLESAMATIYGLSGASLVSGTGNVLVASADAPTKVKNVADYVCTGTADNVKIASAVQDAAALNSRNAGAPVGALQRGKVQLTGGRFNLAAPVPMYTGTSIGGMGYLTECRAVGNTGAGLFTLAGPEEHLVTISDMYLEGNGSSGGSCDAIYMDYTDASPSTSGYPDTNSDADNHIYNLYIRHFDGTSTRNGITITASGSGNSRGHDLHDIQVRVVTGTAISLASASDSRLRGIHIGGAQTGFDIATGNVQITNCKAYYCDVTAFSFTGSRATASNLESQDSATGFLLSSANGNFSNLTADTFSTDGIKITTGVVLSGASVYIRGSGRYSTGLRGFNIGSALANLHVTGTVFPSGITTPISGTAHATQAAGKILNGTSAPLSLG